MFKSDNYNRYFLQLFYDSQNISYKWLVCNLTYQVKLLNPENTKSILITNNN